MKFLKKIYKNSELLLMKDYAPTVGKRTTSLQILVPYTKVTVQTVFVRPALKMTDKERIKIIKEAMQKGW